MAIRYVDIEKPAPAVKPDKVKAKAKAERALYRAGETVAAQKPWEAAGVSRRTWYRTHKGAAGRVS